MLSRAVLSTTRAKFASAAAAAAPKPFHLEHVKKRLEFTVPLMFESRLDYTFYRDDIVLDDQIFQTTRIGLTELMHHFSMISILGRIGFPYIEMKPLNISPILEDGTVRLRWRVQYLNWLQFLNFRNYNATYRKKNEKWYDGYSVFHVDGEGFVYKATIQKTMPDDSLKISSISSKKELPGFSASLGVPSTASTRCFHTSNMLSFHFMKRNVTIDPELAQKREERKRRKLERAITQLKKYTKKPRPVEELRIAPKMRTTLGDRRREEMGVEEDEEEQFRQIIVRKNYTRSRVPLARKDLRWIKRSIEAQQKALELLNTISPQLYEAAVQLDTTIIPMQIEGPPLTPAIANYKSPDGEYQDVTKEWIQPTIPAMDKRFGVGKLIKTPEFQKRTDVGKWGRTAKTAGPWLREESYV